jgi:hypothetical protein
MAYLHTIKTIATSAVTAALVAALAAPAAPGPVPPPAGTDSTITQRLDAVEAAASDAERAAWEWRAFQRCTHQRHITYPTRANAAVPVTWKRDCPDLEVPR